MSGMDWELLDRYLARECSEAERELVERWLAASPVNRRYAELLASAVAATPEAPRERVWEAIERELAPRPRRFALESGPRRFMLAKAAAVLLVVGAGAVAGRALFVSRPEAPAPAPAPRVVTTPPGQRASFRLPDGTRVILGVASTLRHRPGFAAGTREVELEGEAYFDVVHDEQRPFVVHAGDIVAKDLGTEFVVRAYPEDRHARVVVREGIVALRAATTDSLTARTIQPGQLGRLAADGTPIVEPADTAAQFAWTEGRLVFDSIPLRDALPQLSRWYDLDFRLADSSLGRVPLTAAFGNQPTDDVLELLAASLGLRQVRHGRVVTFHSATGGH